MPLSPYSNKFHCFKFKLTKVNRNEAKVVMQNFILTNCNYQDRHLITIKANSQLEFKNGTFEGNIGHNSIFLVEKNGLLNLSNTKFDGNKQVSNSQASIVTTEADGDVFIEACDFTNHSCMDYPQSCNLIAANGNLNIISSNFKNNNTEKKQLPCISIKVIKL